MNEHYELLELNNITHKLSIEIEKLKNNLEIFTKGRKNKESDSPAMNIIDNYIKDKQNLIDKLTLEINLLRNVINAITEGYFKSIGFICINKRERRYDRYCDECPLFHIAKDKNFKMADVCDKPKNFSK